MISVDDVREVARTLPRSTEVFVRGRLKFRIGSIVWLAFSRDGTEMGFAFPKEWRQALVESEPEKFRLPGQSDLKYNWAEARLEALDPAEIRDLVLGAWSMVVPQYVVDDYIDRERRAPGEADKEVLKCSGRRSTLCRGPSSWDSTRPS
jgi:hypothetical protein